MAARRNLASKTIQEFDDGVTGRVSLTGSVTDPSDIFKKYASSHTVYGYYLVPNWGAHHSVRKRLLRIERTSALEATESYSTIARLRANTKGREECGRELLFADDVSLVAHSLRDNQEISTRFQRRQDTLDFEQTPAKLDSSFSQQSGKA